jgi:hypothetical protein
LYLSFNLKPFGEAVKNEISGVYSKHCIGGLIFLWIHNEKEKNQKKITEPTAI